MEDTREEPIRLTISGLIDDLKNGITRLVGDPGYDPERGSIEEKYGLNKTEVKEIFKHDKLIGLKVRIPKKKRYVLVDDETETVEAPVYSEQNTTNEMPQLETPMDQVEESTQEEVDVVHGVSEEIDF